MMMTGCRLSVPQSAWRVYHTKILHKELVCNVETLSNVNELPEVYFIWLLYPPVLHYDNYISKFDLYCYGVRTNVLVYNNSPRIGVYLLQNESLSATETQAIILFFAIIIRKAFQMIRFTSDLIQPQLLKLRNSLLKVSLLRLRVRKSVLLHVL